MKHLICYFQGVDAKRPNSYGFVVDWLAEFSTHFKQISVITFHFHPQQTIPGNVRIYEISTKNAFFRYLKLTALSCWLCIQQPDSVLFAHIIETFAVAAGILGRVFHIKSFYWYCSGYSIRRNFLAQLSFKLVTKVLTCSAQTRASFLQVTGAKLQDKIVAIGHGISLAHFKSTTKIPKGADFKILVPGRIAPVKGLEDVFDAIKHINVNKRVQVDIVGVLPKTNHHYYDQLTRRVRRLTSKTLKISIDPRGYSYESASALYQQHDLIIVSTKSTGFDKTLIEAWSSGVLAIGTVEGYPKIAHKFPKLFYSSGNLLELSQKINAIIKMSTTQKVKLRRHLSNYVGRNFSLHKLILTIVKYLNESKN